MHHVDDSLTLNGCQFVSNFTNGVMVSWLKNGMAITNGSSYQSVWNSGHFVITLNQFVISNLKFTDSGNYSCQLKYNSSGELIIVESGKIELIVQSKS